jgi:tRNA-2-methylthio-N6-dimethylallyladenosine synthase
MKEDKKKVFIKNFGCQMNVRDSEVIAGLLKAEGCSIVSAPEDADVLILNTCSVRQHAEDKVWSEVGRFRRDSSQKAGTVSIIGIVGCMAKNHQEDIFKRAPQVDFAVGPSDIHKIPEIIKKVTKSQNHKVTSSSLFKRKIWETDGGIRPEEIYHTGYYGEKEHAYVVISEGCSNYCSYCVVPYVRGPLRNRNYKDILQEIRGALDCGITKVTLLGQNVNAYQYEKVNFVRLVRLVNCVEGLEEFSFITSHPKDTSLELFQSMAECDKLKKYLHLPVQAGADRILKLMNRGYTGQFYLDLIESYRKIVKNGVLTSDIIVGFPTETEGDFQDTYNLVNDALFNAAFIFKYSPRPHTPAVNMADDVERKEKERRHALILGLQKEISKKK